MITETKTRKLDSNITVYEISGRLNLGNSLLNIESGIKKLIDQGSRRLIVDLTDVNYIDSSGIGELVSGFTAVRNRSGELKLLNLTKKVNDLLQLTKLFTVFDVYSDEEAAIRSFR